MPMTRYPKIFLKPGKDAAVRRFHPWIFSGAIGRVEGSPADGDTVAIFSANGEPLATGHFSPGSIAVKIVDFKTADAGPEFWKAKLKSACKARERIGYLGGVAPHACRLVNSEGDMMPGIIIDWYNGVVVIQAHSRGMYNLLPVFTEALQEEFGDRLTAVYYKNPDSRPPVHSSACPPVHPLTRSPDKFLFGSSDPVEITETGHKFIVDFIHGQKTGFFLDQRGNRMFAQFYARGKKVLNAFCYSGAFSVYALKGGAGHVHSVDSSKQAIEWTDRHIALNGYDPSCHTSEVADVKRLLAETSERYDMIILDPPAFAKTHQVSNNALHAYVHINAEAIRRLNAGGNLFTFSCSQPVSREMFRSAVQSAAIEAGRQVKILHHLSQGPDHPVSVFHPEGEYLKGLVLEVQ